jgi:tyrosyl-tRNA synthetase
VTQLYSREIATEAEGRFKREIQNKEEPEIKLKHRLLFEDVRHLNGEIDLRSVLVATALVRSKSEASRLIRQGAVDIYGEKVTKYTIPVEEFTTGEVTTIHIGKLRWCDVELIQPTISGK